MRNYQKSLLSITAALGLLASSPVFADDFAGAFQGHGPHAVVSQTIAPEHKSAAWSIQDNVYNYQADVEGNEGVESNVIAKMMEMIHGWQEALGYPAVKL